MENHCETLKNIKNEKKKTVEELEKIQNQIRRQREFFFLHEYQPDILLVGAFIATYTTSLLLTGAPGSLTDRLLEYGRYDYGTKLPVSYEELKNIPRFIRKIVKRKDDLFPYYVFCSESLTRVFRDLNKLESFFLRSMQDYVVPQAASVESLDSQMFAKLFEICQVALFEEGDIPLVDRVSQSLCYGERLVLTPFELENMQGTIMALSDISACTENKYVSLYCIDVVAALNDYLTVMRYWNSLHVVSQGGTDEKIRNATIYPPDAQGFFEGWNVPHSISFDKNASRIISECMKLYQSSVNKPSIAISITDRISSIVSILTNGVNIEFPQLKFLDNVVEKGAAHLKRFALCIVLYFILMSLKRLGVLSEMTSEMCKVIFLFVFGTNILFPDLFTNLYSSLVEFTMSDHVILPHKPVPEGADCRSLSIVTEGFLSAIQLAILGKAWHRGGDLITAFKTSVGGFEKLRTDMGDSFTHWLTVAQKFVIWICDIFKVQPWIFWAGKYPKLTEYADMTTKFTNLMDTDPVLTYDKGRKLQAILKFGRDIAADIPNTASYERNFLKGLNDVLEPWKMRLSRANFMGNGPRVKPVGVMFIGPSQVGKSECNNIFCREVAARCLPYERLESFFLNPSTEIYNRIIEQEFWDSWTEQSIVQIDEIGSRYDVKGQNNEGFESIRLINGNNFGLHAAELHDKGRLNARPILVSATSNNAWFDWDSLSHQEAFENRYKAYICVPKIEFLKDPLCDRFDFHKCVMRDIADDEWFERFEHLEFFPYDLTLARRTKEMKKAIIGNRSYSYDEVLDKTVSSIKATQAKGQKILERHAEIVQTAALSRPDAEAVKDLLQTLKIESPHSNKDPFTLKAEKFHEWSKALDDELGRVCSQGASPGKALIAQLVIYIVFLSSLSGTFFGFNMTVTSLRRLYYDIKTSYPSFKMSLIDFVVLAKKYVNKENIESFTASVKKSTGVFAQGIGQTFGCGNCFVCQIPHLTAENLQVPWSCPTLWPDYSYDIMTNFYGHMDLSDLDFNLLTNEPVLPYCLALKKDVYYGSSVIKFEDSVRYAGLIRIAAMTSVKAQSSKSFKSIVFNAFQNTGVLGTAWRHLIKNSHAYLPTMGLVVGGLITAWSIIKRIIPQSSSSLSKRSSRKSMRVRRARPKVEVKAQAHVDPISRSIAVSVIQRNQWYWGLGNMETPTGLFTMLADFIGVMPRHFAEMASYQKDKGHDHVWISPVLEPDYVVKKQWVPLDCFDFIVLEGREKEDLVYFKVDPKYMPMAKNITKYFVSKDDCPTEKFIGNLYVVSQVRGAPVIETRSDWILPGSSVVYGDDSEGTELFELTNSYKYNMKTVIGDCGSLLLENRGKNTGARILGLHVAGNMRGLGWSQPLLKEDIEAILEIEGAQYDVLDGYHVVSDEISIQGFVNLGTVKGPRRPKETKIVKSPLHSVVFPCKTEPVVLKDFSLDGKMFKVDEIARSSYIFGMPKVNDSQLTMCAHATIVSIVRGSIHWDDMVRRDLTYHEACYGIDGRKFMNGIKRSTSPGFPFSVNNPFPGTKHHWFGKDEKKDESHKPFREIKRKTLDIISLAESGVRSFNVCTDFLKDERRKFGRSARAISGTAQDYALACIIKFGGLCDWLMENNVHNGMCVGMNPFGTDWSRLAKDLNIDGNENSISENWMDGDFSHFDGSHFRAFMWTFNLLADWFYGEESISRRVLLEDLMNSVHVTGDNVYLWMQSLPSGHPLTAILNCYMNLLLNRYAFVSTYHRLEGKEVSTLTCTYALREYDLYVVVKVYGDDSVDYVHSKVQKYMNMKEHAVSLDEIGYTFTDASKTLGIHGLKKWTDLTFLKRSFYFHPVIKEIVAPIAIASIQDMVQWTKKKDTNYSDLKKTIATALRELGFHKPEVFRENSQKIVFGSSKFLDYCPDVIDYDALAFLNYGRDEFL